MNVGKRRKRYDRLIVTEDGRDLFGRGDEHKHRLETDDLAPSALYGRPETEIPGIEIAGQQHMG
jgi:hypothetical protein